MTLAFAVDAVEMRFPETLPPLLLRVVLRSRLVLLSRDFSRLTDGLMAAFYSSTHRKKNKMKNVNRWSDLHQCFHKQSELSSMKFKTLTCLDELHEGYFSAGLALGIKHDCLDAT